MEYLELIWKFIQERPDSFGIIAALTIATIGFFAKHISDLTVRRYEARMAFVTAQLRDLYGPLYLLAEAGDRTWKEFRTQFRPNRRMFDKANPLTDEEKAEYVQWLEAAFVPSNEKMRTIIERNSHLFVEGKVPKIILDLLVHFDDLGVVLAKLKAAKDDNVFPNAAYPQKFREYVRKDYESVVQIHSKLISRQK